MRALTAVFFTLVMTGLAGCYANLLEEMDPSRYPIHGIDVSKFQGVIDWNDVRRSGVRFAFIKATEGGDHLDSAFTDNWLAAKAAGVPRGAYHFYYFCRPVEDQIAWFIENVPVDPDALPPVLDMEWNAHSPTCQRRPPPRIVRRDMEKFLTAVERRYGKKPVIYTSVDFYLENLRHAFPEHSFWVRSVAAAPESIYKNRAWVFWQYTAEGRVGGIKGDVDRNAFFGSEEDWAAFLAGRK